jgi:hypothetical protein
MRIVKSGQFVKTKKEFNQYNLLQTYTPFQVFSPESFCEILLANYAVVKVKTP